MMAIAACAPIVVSQTPRVKKVQNGPALQSANLRATSIVACIEPAHRQVALLFEHVNGLISDADLSCRQSVLYHNVPQKVDCAQPPRKRRTETASIAPDHS